MKIAVCILRDSANNPHVECFAEVAEAMHATLVDAGHDSILVRGMPPDRRAIVFGLAAYPHAVLRQDTIIYNMEQIGSPWFGPNYIDVLRMHTVWDYSAANAARYPSVGLPTPTVVPFGYHPCLERIQRAPEHHRNIDVLHIGSMNARRSSVLDQLAAQGLDVVRIFSVYGAERDKYLACAKVLINIHYYDSAVTTPSPMASA